MYVDLEYRTEFGHWLNAHNLKGAGAEVGCAYGGYAEIMLCQWQGQEYYMVDPWIRQDPAVYREDCSKVNFDAYWDQVQGLAAKDKRVRLVRKFSVDAAAGFSDASLDFVFIDANHSYDAVSADLAAWWPKVKPGGVFSGHDYGNDINWPNHCEVKRAVDVWATDHHLTFVISRCSSWWILKA